MPTKKNFDQLNLHRIILEKKKITELIRDNDARLGIAAIAAFDGHTTKKDLARLKKIYKQNGSLHQKLVMIDVKISQAIATKFKKKLRKS